MNASLVQYVRIAKHGIGSGGKFSTPAKHRKGRPAKVLDDFDKCAIRQKVHYFYTVKKEVPTIAKILAQIKEDMNYDGSREHLRKLLKNNGFQYKKCRTNLQALIEKPMIAHKRERYLKTIMENRNLPQELQKDIIYLDELIIRVGEDSSDDDTESESDEFIAQSQNTNFGASTSQESSSLMEGVEYLDFDLLG